MVMSGCVRRSYRYYPADSKNLPANLKPTPTEAPKPAEPKTQDPKPSGPKPAAVSTSDLNWVPAADPRFTVSGLPYFKESGDKWQRLPDRAKAVVPPAVWRLSLQPSGGRIRFRSNTTNVALHVTYANLPNMRNMHAFGQAGIDVYIDGNIKGTLAPRKELEVQNIVARDLEKKEHDVTIYLPLYIEVNVQSIGLDPGATIDPPKPFAIAKPVVYYGTSITQGGCASHPGNSYQAMLGRRTNTDFVNFGFSGSGKGEKEVIDFVDAVDASCYVIDMAQNNPTVEDFAAHFAPLLAQIRARRPNTPILCTTPIYAATEYPWFGAEKINPAMREVIRKAVKARQAKGDRNIQIIEGFSLLGPSQGDGLVDGVHPNDLGFYWMTNGLEPHLRQVLGLPSH